MSKQPETRKDQGSWTPRKLAISLNIGAAIVLIAAVVLMVNYLSYRHYVRLDWSRSKYYSLSDKTRGLLGTLTNSVDVVVFFQPNHRIYEDVANLLKEYEYASKALRVEWVDPDRDLARAEELAQRYDVDPDLANIVVFDAAGRRRYMGVDDIGDFDYSPVRFGQAPVLVAFKGEQAFSSAIQSITQAEKPVLYFLSGHGERDLDDYDPRTGYSGIARELERDNIETRKLVLGEERAIPENCDALVVAGPQRKLSEPELDLISGYLDRNGRLLALVDAHVETGLEPLLEKWSLNLGEDLVVDGTRTLTGRELFVTEYGNHPITETLRGMTSVFSLPRSVQPSSDSGKADDPADKPHATALASCSEAGWAEQQLKDGLMRFDPEVDIPGPVAVAAAVEKGPVPGIDVQIQPTRLVVFGDSDFVANGSLMIGGDLDFFMNAVNWLLEREELMAIAPKPVEESRLIMSRRQLWSLFWAVVFGMPAAVAVVGAMVWMRRRG